MRQLSTVVSLLVILALCGNLWWLSKRQTSETATISACQIPIRWRLASLDEKFKLSHPQALDAIRMAAQAWNERLGLQAFVEDPQSGFPINFIYDERQQQLLATQRLERNVERYDDYLQQLAKDLQVLSEDHRRQLDEFNQRKQQLSEQVASGAIDRSSSMQQQAELQLQADGLNALAAKINDKNQHYQQSLNDRNQLLQEAQPSGKIAEVGLLLRTGSMLEMRIFAYRDEAILVRTLTHEFGHALGIDHLAEVDAIMHDMLGAEQDQLTPADIQAAQQRCAHRR